MKTFLLGAIAATLVAGPLAVSAVQAAPQRERTTLVRERPDGTVVTRTTVRERDWAPGQRFNRRAARDYRVVRDWRRMRLAAPGRGRRWVRSGRDVVLVRDNGTVVRVIQRRF